MKTGHSVISYTICAALLVGACSESGTGDVGVAEQAAISVTSGVVTATLETTSSWSGGFCQSVTIKNAGTAVTNWALSVATNGATISNIWSAVQTTSGTTMTVTPVSYNKAIASGSSVNFGYCGTGATPPTLTSITVTGGADGSGGAPSTGGSSAKGGTTSTGGSSAKGGTTSTGGSSAKGGSSGTVIPNTCSEAQKTITSNSSGTHCGYTYEYWKDSGSGSLILKSDGFSVDWSNINNLLGRKGIRPGSANLSVTYEANYQPNGNSYLCVYGWTRNPLIEYYIVDSWGSWRPPGGTSLGSIASDGGVYDIYKTQRVSQPSIEGTKTFYQYWSVRQSKRSSGTITVANHVNAWAAKGMNIGSFYEVSMTVEGYQSSGKADVKMVIK